MSRERKPLHAAPPAQPAAPERSSIEQVPWELPGEQLRTNLRRARRGFYAPKPVGAPTTTRQAQIINSAVIGPPTGTSGVVIGRDALSRYPIAHDPITGYNSTPRLVSSPNVIIMGDVGSGKSAHTKCAYVLRPLIVERRRAVVFDVKNQKGEGEYSDSVRAFGHEPIRFSIDGRGTQLNLLDPRISRATGIQGQMQLLRVIISLARGGRELNEWEGEALRAALHRTVGQFEDARTPTIADVLPNLSRVSDLDDYTGLSASALDELHRAGLSVRFTLNQLLDEYGRLLDGETSAEVDLTGKLTSFDVSQLPKDGPAIPTVMAIGHMWLRGRLNEEPGWATNCIYEEGWHIASGPAAELARSNQKLSRGVALSNVFVFHKGTDIPPGSPSVAMIQEAQTVHVYRQSREEDARWAGETFGFSLDSIDQLQTLPDGWRFDKIASHSETLVQHVRSDWETQLTDTDAAMNAAVNGTAAWAGR